MVHGALTLVRRRLVMLALCGALLAPLPPTVTAQESIGTPTPTATDAAMPAATPIGAAQVYADPNGLYTIPIPIGWTVEPREGYALVQDPEQAISIYVVTAAAADLAQAIADGWQLVAPAAAPPPGTVLNLPTPPGIDEVLGITYDNGARSGRLVQALGVRAGETSFLLLFDGAVDAAVRRSSQVDLVISGLDILAVEQIDLTGQVPPPFASDLLTAFETYVEQEMDAFGIPGAAVAIVQDGKVVYRHGFGVRELGGTDPVTPDTVMMAGSITKPMTTMMMGTLVDDGVMSWDTPAQAILPSFAVADPALSAKVTMRNLVCACTGVPRRDLELAFNADQLSAEDMITSLAGFTFFTPIGEAFQYSNQMVAAGGYLATLAARGSLRSLEQDYIALMQARILDPIGMADSTFIVTVDDSPANLAVGHQRANDGKLSPETRGIERLFDPVEPAAGLWTTADDLARFLITLLAHGVGPEGNRVVSAANLNETMTPQVAVSADESYGLGWFIDTYHGQTVVSHDGNTHGYTANLTFLPDANFGIVVLTNAQQVNLFTDAVRWRLIELAFDQEPVYDELVDYSLAAWQRQVAYTVASIGPAPRETDIAPLLGTYTNPALGEVRLLVDDGKFWLDAGEFRSELRPLRGAAAATADYIGFDSLGASHLVTINTVSPTPSWTLTSAVDGEQYRFTPIVPAASLASPAASLAP